MPYVVIFGKACIATVYLYLFLIELCIRKVASNFWYSKSATHAFGFNSMLTVYMSCSIVANKNFIIGIDKLVDE